MENEQVERHLVEKYNIAIRAMDYWSIAEKFYKLHRPVRASFVNYNIIEDVHFFLDAVKAVCTK